MTAPTKTLPGLTRTQKAALGNLFTRTKTENLTVEEIVEQACSIGQQTARDVQADIAEDFLREVLDAMTIFLAEHPMYQRKNDAYSRACHYLAMKDAAPPASDVRAVTDELVKNARSMQKDGYRGPLPLAKAIIDYVAAAPASLGATVADQRDAARWRELIQDDMALLALGHASAERFTDKVDANITRRVAQDAGDQS